MLKKHWFIAAIALAGGIMLGTLGVVLIENPAQPTALLTLLQGKDSSIKVVAQNDNTKGLKDNESGQKPDTQDVNSQKGTDDTLGSAGGNHTGETGSDPVAEEIIADYKQNIGTLFDAWKTTDSSAFQEKLTKAYTGDLLNKHVERAKPYIDQGLGMNVSSVTFDKVTVENYSGGTATLQADYFYRTNDYNTLEQKDLGEMQEQTVHVRVNLIKINAHWYITGETRLG